MGSKSCSAARLVSHLLTKQIRGFAKGRFPKGWFRRMFPRNENPNEGTFAKTTLLETALLSPNDPFGVDKGVVSKRVVSADVPPERKPERAYVRQNHPFTKPPFYLPVTNVQSVAGELFCMSLHIFSCIKLYLGAQKNSWVHTKGSRDNTLQRRVLNSMPPLVP